MTNVVCLLVTAGELKGHKYFVKSKEPILVGRSEEANIKITNDEFCSRKHASIFWENNQCCISDLKSTNGTCVNDVEITKAVLKNGDIVRIGGTELKVAIKAVSKKAAHAEDDIRYED